MENVVDRYRHMAIREDEEEINLDEGELEGVPAEEVATGFPVIGQVLMDRKVRFSELKDQMLTLWRPGKGMSVKEIGGKRYVFSFNHRFDMKRVLDGGLWQYGRSLVLLKEIMPDDIPHKIVLNEAEFWVQVHNVPYSLVNLGTVRRVGSFLGEFVKYDDNQKKEKLEPYMRVKILMKMDKSLKKETNLKKDGKSFWVDFKYERLSTFCFSCGLVGHSDYFSPLNYEKDWFWKKDMDPLLEQLAG
ncbi:unnamed protein product [Cuscuta epithymum]|uniref:DUF4283 domain-containing protein n=1 Tax=Cuscuta epithymum TaxID=186058 RepID=A0AAV0FB01_9ASTE|nr:unnamed protein product [Cuscuta epithymum]CAH9132684.1 unnamed protein product [Cuscuta epithymum]